MTPNEFAKVLESKIDELRRSNKPFEIAVKTSVAETVQRAFVNKRNENGESFQYNSTTPIYVSDNQSPQKLSHKGKNGNSKTKSGKPHKTTYFDSYKSFRDSIGRDTDAVDWQLTTDLMSDYGNSPIGTSEASLDPAVRLDPNLYITHLTRSINIAKYNGLSQRYGQFLTLSQSEKERFYKINELELSSFLAS